LAGVARAVHRVERDIETRGADPPRAELLAEKNARRVVLDAFADHDFSGDIHEIEHTVDRVASRRVRRFLLSATKPMDDIERRIFRRTHKLKFDRPLGVGHR